MIRTVFQILFAFFMVVFPLQGYSQEGPIVENLTIDMSLQRLAKRLLQNKQGSIVAIEPATGRVLALVSNDKLDDGVNRAISTSYSPGSTFKVAQALFMLSEGAIDTKKTYACHHGFSFNGIRIGCHPHRTPLAMIQAIGQSCNAFFCKSFQETIDNRQLYPSPSAAINRWADYMHSMGLGVSLGIDLENEDRGLIPDSAYLQNLHRKWNGTTIMWVGMGQGEVKTTPLQLCNLAAMVGNRGYYITPYIHENATGNAVDTTQRHCMATPEAIDVVIKGMRAAVKGGTAHAINAHQYEICGKTGTAENKGDDHSTFMGFAPKDLPRIAVSVYVENGGFGADLAAPMASLIIEQYLNGRLSEKSAKKAERWAKKKVKITPIEIPITLDDM